MIERVHSSSLTDTTVDIPTKRLTAS